MPILYASVSRGNVVLAECSAAKGNADAVARKILDKVSHEAGVHRASYAQGTHIFHLLTDGSLIFLAMADDTFGRRLPYAFLEEIRSRFTAMYGTSAQTALAYAMNDEFSRVLAQQMEYFSQNPQADPFNKVKDELEEVKNVMVHNIDKVLERGEKIELLVDKTEAMQGEAFRFKRQARQLKQKMWWRSVRFAILLGAVITFFLLLIIMITCGGFTLHRCRGQ